MFSSLPGDDGNPVSLQSGVDLSFEFLTIPAGYDINQYLIPYNNRDTVSYTHLTLPTILLV